jgi:hypothetical protein
MPQSPCPVSKRANRRQEHGRKTPRVERAPIVETAPRVERAERAKTSWRPLDPEADLRRRSSIDH